jgi:hypothetical protein
MADYTISCDCGVISLDFTGVPRARAICDRDAFPELHAVPPRALAAWAPERRRVPEGEAERLSFPHPGRRWPFIPGTLIGH